MVRPIKEFKIDCWRFKMDIAKNREEFWGKEAGEKFYKKNLTVAKFRTPFIAKMIKINGAKSVLELGCNVGRNLAAIHKLSPDIRITGFDIAEDAIQYAKEVEKNPAEFIVGSLYDLSQFDDNSFDIVFTSSVLFHIPSEKVPGVIKEMSRIASKFIFNIERHSKVEKAVVWREEVPHQWTADYEQAYKNAGLDPVIHGMQQLLPKQKMGGATHLIYASLTNTSFKVR